MSCKTAWLYILSTMISLKLMKGMQGGQIYPGRSTELMIKANLSSDLNCLLNQNQIYTLGHKT